MKCVPLKLPGKYCVIEPPSGAPGLMETRRTYMFSGAKLADERAKGTEALRMVGIGTRLGHSYWSPRRPAWVKLLACVQLVRLGEV